MDVAFSLKKEDFKYIHQDLTVSVESGEFDLMVGSNSEDVEIKTVYLNFD